ncbi:MAG: glycosyltransferase [Acholeplasma sp.]|nr:glycosyltransferase [Acholeplasma sp.]
MGAIKIIKVIYDVPATEGGALSILFMYYSRAVEDINNRYIFIVSTPKFDERENVKIVRFPWVKKSWLHRIFFEIFCVKKVVSSYSPDQIIALHNMTLYRVKTPHILYVHQPLPFSSIRFNLFKEPKFWIYQNIIGQMIIKSINKANCVIVQTNWMKENLIKYSNVPYSKILVESPAIISSSSIEVYKESDEIVNFIYPTSEISYKNYGLIIEAFYYIPKEHFSKIAFYITLKGNENKKIRTYYKIVQKNKYPIFFVGKISKEKVFEYYSKSTLVFPSLIETFGLPLLEARMHESPILAANLEYSREILDGYTKISYFDPKSSEDLSKKIVSRICSIIGG